MNYPNDMYNVFIEKMRDQIVEFSVRYRQSLLSYSAFEFMYLFPLSECMFFGLLVFLVFSMH